MRVFLAIEIPKNVIEVLVEIQELLRARLPGVRWEKREKLHITLVFLEEVGEGRLSDLEEAVSAGLGGVGRFKLGLGGFGVFPSERRPRVVWIGLRGDVEALSRLQRQLVRALSEAGFSSDRKKFHAHVTIGRVKGHLEGMGERLGIGEMRGVEKAEFEVGSVTIMESQLRPTGSVYTPLVRIPLGK